MPISLSGGNAFLTGAASGIGQAVAIGYAKAGAASVFGCDLNAMDETEKQCKKVAANPNFTFIQHIMDVRKEDEVIAAVDKCVKDLSRIDYAANIAGIADSDVQTIDQKIDEWDNVININLRGYTSNELKEFTPDRPTRGSVINMGSVGGLVALPGIRTSYVTSKHAIAGMTKSAAVSVGLQSIRVNSVNPGYIATPMVKAAYDDLTPFGEPVALKRMGEADEIADVIIFLSSSESSYITGSSITADGGLTIMPR
ncbi:hypothetical protein D9758_017504 [Tetrapyrgos nigripes]|uniref:Uncharacterized protein n=1 Tax=Tetrapyrgos nigripes TaxID=182062 RepID=A0A8H5B151_9AGAR|nr:hypothetical protein D9758_017504 [Tetrapyrgos nigripes]